MQTVIASNIKTRLSLSETSHAAQQWGRALVTGRWKEQAAQRVLRESRLTTVGNLMAMEFYLRHEAFLEGQRGTVRTVFGPVYVVNISTPAHPQLLIIQPTSSDGRLVRREATPAVKQLMRGVVNSIRSSSS